MQGKVGLQMYGWLRVALQQFACAEVDLRLKIPAVRLA
jgi:hypothetical protein